MYKRKFNYCDSETLVLVCHCGQIYSTRIADLRRGWGYSCSKSCAATRRIHNKRKPLRCDFLPLPKIKRRRNV